MDARASDLLMVVVDVSPAWVASEPAAAEAESESVRFADAVTAVQLFLSAYCALSRHSNLLVLAYNGAVGGAVWPPADTAAVGAAAHLRPAEVMATVGGALLDLAKMDAAPAGDAGDARLSPRFATLSACMSKAVCHLAALAKRQPRLRPRLLVLKRAADVPGEYIAFVNATYSLQRFRTPIDSIQFGVAPAESAADAGGGRGTALTRSVFLQQAAHLTEGVHGTPRGEENRALFQFMVTLFLPDTEMRSLLLYPPRTEVDLRASCFCHHRHVSLAWVCSVCLSVWCDLFAHCDMCGSAGPGAAATLPAASAGVSASTPGDDTRR